MFKIGDKIKVTSKNEEKEGIDFIMYTTVQGISYDVDGETKYLVGLTKIEEKLMTKCTKEEISKYYT